MILNITNSSNCQRDSIHFENNSSGALSYQWIFGDIHTSILENPTIAFSLPGTYQITLIGYDSLNLKGCANQITKSIQIYERGVPEFEFLRSYNCGVTDISISNTTEYPDLSNGIFIWEWNDGSTETSYEPTARTFQNYSLDTSITISLKLKVITVGGCVDSLIKVIKIPEFPYGLRLPTKQCLAFKSNKEGFGRNSKFILPFERKENIGHFVFSVYNQFGLKVFETRDLEESWDGKYRGEIVEVGMYQAVAEIGGCDGRGEIRRIRFNLCILRGDDIVVAYTKHPNLC